MSIYKEYSVGEVLGGFVGYLQHSKPAKGVNGKSGMMAHVFGENGDASDTITALNLTKFLNIPVKVTIWSLKDKNGRFLKDEEKGKFPKITQFIGFVHRPSSSLSGLTAKFFGEDGGNADAINELNRTEHNNALVYCQVQLAEENSLLSEIETTDPSELDKESTKLTQAELKKLEKEQAKFKEADQILVMNGFYKNRSVVHELGVTPESFEKWLETQPCSVANCPNHKVVVRRIGEGEFECVPLCARHNLMLDSGDIKNVIAEPEGFFRQMSSAYLQDHVKQRFSELFKVDAKFYLDPKMVYSWSQGKRLDKLIPYGYRLHL